MSILVLLLLLSFFIAPILTTPFIFGALFLNRKYSKFFLLFFSVAISLLIIRYLTDGRDDSSYHYASIAYFSTIKSFPSFFYLMMHNQLSIFRYDYSDSPIFGIFLYAISKTKILTLSSFIVSVFTYFLSLYPLADLFAKEKLNRLTFLFSTIAVFLLNNYRYTTSGMRYCLVVAILIFLFYKDSQRGFKFDYFLFWYLIPFFIHSSVAIYLVLRVFYKVFKKFNFLTLLGLSVLFPITLQFILWINTKVDLSYLNLFARKLIAYTQEGAYEELFNSKIYLKMYAGTILSFVYMFFYRQIERYSFNNIDKEFSAFIRFIFYLSLFNIGLLPFYNLWDRHMFLLYSCLIIAFAMIFSIHNVRYNFNNQFTFVVFLLICITSSVVGFIYNLNFPIKLVDYSILEILTNNLFQFFQDIPKKI